MYTRTRRAVLTAAAAATTGCVGLSDRDEYQQWGTATGGVVEGAWPTFASGLGRGSTTDAVPTADSSVEPLFDEPGISYTQPAIREGVAYIGLDGETTAGLAAIELTSGEKRWQTEATRVTATPTIVGDTVICAGEYVFALDRRDGSRLWRNRRDAVHENQAPVVVGNSVVLPEGDVLNLTTGRLRDRRFQPPNGTPDGTRADEIAATDGQVFITYRGKQAGIRAFDANAATQQWQIRKTTGVGTPVVTDEHLSAVIGGRRLAGIDRTSGDTAWTVDADRRFGSRPAASGNKIVAFEHPNRLHAVAPATGQRMWLSTVPGEWARPVWLVATPDSVFITDETGTAAVVAADNGSPIWQGSLSKDDVFLAHQPAVGDGSAVFTGRCSAPDGSTSGLFRY